jgi:hypothetical protein
MYIHHTIYCTKFGKELKIYFQNILKLNLVFMGKAKFSTIAKFYGAAGLKTC